MSKTPIRYVPCRVEPGMFRDEWLVFVDARHPKNHEETVRAQLFVDHRLVANIRGTPRRHNPAEGWLRVSLAGREGDFALLILPQPAQPFGEYLLVDERKVKEEPGT